MPGVTWQMVVPLDSETSGHFNAGSPRLRGWRGLEGKVAQNFTELGLHQILAIISASLSLNFDLHWISAAFLPSALEVKAAGSTMAPILLRSDPPFWQKLSSSAAPALYTLFSWHAWSWHEPWGRRILSPID